MNRFPFALAIVFSFILFGLSTWLVRIPAAHRLYLFGTNERLINLKILIEGQEPAGFYLGDVSNYLPESVEKTFKSRPPLASPVHQGDLAVLYRRLQL